uniref:T-box transcription factor Tb n=1 Tax=Eptatretus burgeri TaxID=7764 RepID=A0A8C4QPB6_EPTBU
MCESNGLEPPGRLEQLLSVVPSKSTIKSEASERAVRVVLEECALWEQFHLLSNEMIVTKTGRRMFPVIKVSVSGLDPQAMYSLLLDFSAADSYRWRYVNGEWVAGGKPEPQPPSCVYIHPDSPNFGAHWMRAPVSFCKVKLSNKMNASGQVMLNSLHKYQPRIHIICVGGSQGLLSSHAFPETCFIAVTAYQNEEITALKIQHNPFAKAFLDKRRSESPKENLCDLSDIQPSSYSLGDWFLPGQQHYPGSFPLPGATACERFPSHQAHHSMPYQSPYNGQGASPKMTDTSMMSPHDTWPGLQYSAHGTGGLHHTTALAGSVSPISQAMHVGLPMTFFRGASSSYPLGSSSSLHIATPTAYDSGSCHGDSTTVDSSYDVGNSSRLLPPAWQSLSLPAMQ